MIELSEAQIAPINPTSRFRPTSAGRVITAPADPVSVAMSISLPVVPRRAGHPSNGIPDGRMSMTYASSENIVEIKVEHEKSPSGFVLITQITALFP
jgi:hypothetical protein